MRIAEILSTRVVDNEPTFRVRDEQGNEHDLIFANGTGFGAMNGLVRAAHVIHRDAAAAGAADRGPVYQVTDCHVLVTENQGQGISVRTRDGFDFPLVLNPQMRLLVVACIDEIDNPHLGGVN